MEGGLSAFQSHDFHFPMEDPGLGLALTFVNEIERIQNDLFLCLFSFLFCFFFLYYSLTHRNFQKTFLSSILHTGNRTLSHPHKYTHILSVTSIYYLLAINLQRSQSAPPHPRVQMALFGTESGIGTSRALLPV